jgi:acetyl esterase/lipase
MYSYTLYEDLPYYSGSEYHHKKHLLDLYIPQDMVDFDTVIFVHGGGWKMGDKSMHAHIGRTLAQRGIGTAVINYRLSPQVKYPHHMIDVSRAAWWAMNTISTYGGTESRVFLMGHSAGAHLVALFALHPSYHNMQGIHSFKGIICLSGIYDLPSLMKTPFGQNIIPPVFGDDPDVWNDASPLYHASTTRLPFFLMVAERDFSPLKSQALQFKKVVNHALYFEIPGKNHFNCIWDFGKEGDPTVMRAVSFIRSL